MDDDAIRALLLRFSRPHSSGGAVIERATILAEGADSTAILAWIDEHDGQAETLVPAAAARGLHSARVGDTRAAAAAAPRRYVLPPGVLA